MVMSTEVERGRGATNNLFLSCLSKCWSHCAHEVENLLLKTFLFTTKSMHTKFILLIRDPSLCLPHSQDKVARIFTYQNWTVGELTRLPDHSLSHSPLRQHSNLTNVLPCKLVGEMVTCCYSVRAII